MTCKTLLLAGFNTILLACNNNSNNNAANTDSASHVAHIGTSLNEKNQNQTNAITATIKEMLLT
jgi:ABC-type enterochelin transport system substrate-binding protein